MINYNVPEIKLINSKIAPNSRVIADEILWRTASRVGDRSHMNSLSGPYVREPFWRLLSWCRCLPHHPSPSFHISLHIQAGEKYAHACQWAQSLKLKLWNVVPIVDSISLTNLAYFPSYLYLHLILTITFGILTEGKIKAIYMFYIQFEECTVLSISIMVCSFFKMSVNFNIWNWGAPHMNPG